MFTLKLKKNFIFQGKDLKTKMDVSKKTEIMFAHNPYYTIVDNYHTSKPKLHTVHKRSLLKARFKTKHISLYLNEDSVLANFPPSKVKYYTVFIPSLYFQPYCFLLT